MKRITDIDARELAQVNSTDTYNQVSLKELKEAVRRMTFIIGAKMTRTSKHNHVLYNRICINLGAIAKHLENISEDSYE